MSKKPTIPTALDLSQERVTRKQIKLRCVAWGIILGIVCALVSTFLLTPEESSTDPIGRVYLPLIFGFIAGFVIPMFVFLRDPEFYFRDLNSELLFEFSKLAGKHDELKGFVQDIQAQNRVPVFCELLMVRDYDVAAEKHCQVSDSKAAFYHLYKDEINV